MCASPTYPSHDVSAEAGGSSSPDSPRGSLRATIIVATRSGPILRWARDAADSEFSQIIQTDFESLSTLLESESPLGTIVVIDPHIPPNSLSRRIQSVRDTTGGKRARIIAVLPEFETDQVMSAFDNGADDVIDGANATSVQVAARMEAAIRSVSRVRASSRHSRATLPIDESYLELFDLLPCGVYESTPEGRFLRVNDALRRILGYDTIQDVLALDIGRDLYVDSEQRRTLLEKIDATDVLSGEELVFRRRDGSAVMLLENAFARRDDRGRTVSYIGTLVDITQRAEALKTIDQARTALANELTQSLSAFEIANLRLREKNEELLATQSMLQSSEERFRFLVEKLDDAIYRCDRDDVLQYVSPAFESLVGYPRDQVIGKRWSFFVHPEDARERKRNVARLISGKSVTSMFRMVVSDGSIRHVRSSASPTITDGVLCGFQGILTDITQQYLTEQQMAKARTLLERRNRFVEALLDTFPNAVYYKDLEGRYLGCNRAFQAALKTTEEEIVGKTAHDLWSPEEVEVFDAKDEVLCRDGGQQMFEFEVHPPGGPRRTIVFSRGLYCNENGDPAGIVGVTTDVTEIRQLQERLRHTEKMEALGQLAGSIAHEFNNLIMVVRGTAQLVLRQLPPTDPLSNDLGLILQTAHTASDLSRSLLAFSRRQVLDRSLLDIETMLSALHPMFDRLLHPGITLTRASQSGLPPILADQSSLERAIVNLVLNARDAVGDRGTITISVDSESVSPESKQRPEWVEPGRFLVISIADDGIGMSPEAMERMFDPFFTTKAPGKGTGLGLASVYGAVKQHGGFVVVESQEGIGTTVSIMLPESDLTSSASDQETVHTQIREPTETILVVEDCNDLRSVIVRFLSSLGYTTLEASNGREALATLERDGNRIHAVITDLVMPEIGGVDLLNRARQRWPHLGFVLCSGDRGKIEDTAPILDSSVVRLEKPFDIGDIGSRLEEVLEASGVIRLPDSEPAESRR
jgi:two-component system cell cycle sensor histidine kinase/response regulator CckA